MRRSRRDRRPPRATRREAAARPRLPRALASIVMEPIRVKRTNKVKAIRATLGERVRFISNSSSKASQIKRARLKTKKLSLLDLRAEGRRALFVLVVRNR